MATDVAEPVRRSGIFASLSSWNYSLYFWGQMVSLSGTWMQTVAQSFLVLDLTHSGTQLGLATGARFLPIVLFGPWGGVVADRLDRRKLCVVTQIISGLLALAFGLLVGVHAIEMWMVYVLAVCLGFVNAVDNPARQALIAELVPRDLMQNAVALNSIMVNIGRTAGSALGGLIAAAVGLALCFDLNAVSFGAVVLSLVLMKPSQIYAGIREPKEKRQVRAGMSYVRKQPELLVPLIMVAIVGALAWEFPISLPLVAQGAFHGGAGTYGAMTAVMAAGAAMGGLITAAQKQVKRRSLAVAAIIWGLWITAAALAPNLPAEYAALAFVGYGSVSFNAMAKTSLQLSAVPGMRGRVMALWSVAWQGSTPIGGPIVGWAGSEFGARSSLLVGGIPTILAGIFALPLLVRVDHRRAEGAAADTDNTKEASAADPAAPNGKAAAPE